MSRLPCFFLRNRDGPFLEQIVMCTEWILYDDRKSSGQWLDKHEPPKHFPKAKIIQKKVIVTVWWAVAGAIHYNFLKTDETTTEVQSTNR